MFQVFHHQITNSSRTIKEYFLGIFNNLTIPGFGITALWKLLFASQHPSTNFLMLVSSQQNNSWESGLFDCCSSLFFVLSNTP